MSIDADDSYNPLKEDQTPQIHSLDPPLRREPGIVPADPFGHIPVPTQIPPDAAATLVTSAPTKDDFEAFEAKVMNTLASFQSTLTFPTPSSSAMEAPLEQATEQLITEIQLFFTNIRSPRTVPHST